MVLPLDPVRHPNCELLALCFILLTCFSSELGWGVFRKIVAPFLSFEKVPQTSRSDTHSLHCVQNSFWLQNGHVSVSVSVSVFRFRACIVRFCCFACLYVFWYLFELCYDSIFCHRRWRGERRRWDPLTVEFDQVPFFLSTFGLYVSNGVFMCYVLNVTNVNCMWYKGA